MTVYKATKMRDYKKIAKFVLAQSEGNLGVKSWRTMFPKKEAGRIAHAQLARPQMDIWVVEDDKKKIRLTLSIEKRGPDYNPKETKLLTHASICIADEDYASDDTTYFNELHHHLFKVYPPQGYLSGEFWGNSKIVKWTKAFFGENMQILREAESPEFGKVCFYRISFREEPQ